MATFSGSSHLIAEATALHAEADSLDARSRALALEAVAKRARADALEAQAQAQNSSGYPLSQSRPSDSSFSSARVPPPGSISSAEASVRLGVSVGRLNNLVSSGDLQRPWPRCSWITVSSLEALIARKRETSSIRSPLPPSPATLPSATSPASAEAMSLVQFPRSRARRIA